MGDNLALGVVLDRMTRRGDCVQSETPKRSVRSVGGPAAVRAPVGSRQAVLAMAAEESQRERPERLDLGRAQGREEFVGGGGDEAVCPVELCPSCGRDAQGVAAAVGGVALAFE